MACKTCGNIDHTTNEHEIFKDLFKKSKEDLVSIIISLEVENSNHEYRCNENIMQNVIFNRIKKERELQDEKWGIQNHGPYKWMAILMEEVGEACAYILEAESNDSHAVKRIHMETDYTNELVQVAAVAVAAIECLHRKTDKQVMWRNKLYDIGNRRHGTVELYQNGKLIRTVAENQCQIQHIIKE